MIHIHKYKVIKWEIYSKIDIAHPYGCRDILYMECIVCGKHKEKIIENNTAKQYILKKNKQ